MDSSETSRGRSGKGLLALAAATATTLALAAPAGAAAGGGTATISLAKHDKGRTLSGQGVAVLADAPGARQGRTLTLPIVEVDPTSAATAKANSSIRFKRGDRSVRATELRFELGRGVLAGTVAGEEVEIFKLGAAAAVDGVAGSVTLVAGKLRLTKEAADVLQQKLDLQRALARKGVGTAWLAAQANPTHEAAKPIVSGDADWGVLATWRSYVLGSFGPGSVGTITTAGGATSTGTLSESGAFFSLPAAGGSFEKGLYGAADKLALKTAGSITFTKPGHCIVEVKLSDLELTIDGANSSIVLDSVYDIDTPEGKSCTPQPAVPTADVNFAKLDVSGVSPTYSADGKTITWSAIPATLTAAGAKAFGTGYPEGQALDPVTISVGVG